MESQDFKGKRLFLLRHAAASSNTSDGDKGRPLAPEGREDARVLGNFMKEHALQPDVVLCSPALRTKQTLEYLQESLNIKNIHYPDALYDGNTSDYLYQIQQVENSVRNLMVVAHNPCIYELAILLAAQGSNSMMQRLTEGYPPASLSVVHCLAEEWGSIKPAENTLAILVDPMDYNAPARPTRWM